MIIFVLLSAFCECALKITNNREIIFVSQADDSTRCRFQKLFSIVTQKSIKPSRPETKSGWVARGLWNLTVSLCTSADNLHCSPRPRLHRVCLFAYGPNFETVNLNNFFVPLPLLARNVFEGNPSEAQNGVSAEDFNGISFIYTQKPDKTDKFLTFCWKSHRIIWQFTFLLLLLCHGGQIETWSRASVKISFNGVPSEY